MVAPTPHRNTRFPLISINPNHQFLPRQGEVAAVRPTEEKDAERWLVAYLPLSHAFGAPPPLPAEDLCANHPRPRYGATPCSGSHKSAGAAPVCQNTSIGIPPRGYQ